MTIWTIEEDNSAAGHDATFICDGEAGSRHEAEQAARSKLADIINQVAAEERVNILAAVAAGSDLGDAIRDHGSLVAEWANLADQVEAMTDTATGHNIGQTSDKLTDTTEAVCWTDSHIWVIRGAYIRGLTGWTPPETCHRGSVWWESMGSQVTTLRFGSDRRGTVSGPKPEGAPQEQVVEFPDVVAVELRRLSAGTKKALWRARQLQNRAYNWGVEHALGLHYAGERIPSPRVDSAALTRLRHRCPENRKGGLRLQRGGWCQGVWAVTTWSDRRRSLIVGLSRSGEKVGATAERLTQAGAGDSLPADLRKTLAGLAEIASEYTSTVSGLVTVLEAHPDLSYPADVDTEPVEPPERICEKFHTRSERLIGEHKNLLSLTRRRIGAHARGGGVSPADVDALRTAVTKHGDAVKAHDRMVKAVERHLLAGVKRLFRSRKDMERGAGPALVFYERCRITEDGRLILPVVPGGVSLRLPHNQDGTPFAIPARMKWGGAVHVVDATDQAGRITRRTLPRHRKYRVHFLTKSYAAAPTKPTDRAHTLGADWGVINPLVCSDGTAYPKYATPQQAAQNHGRHRKAQRLQKSMSRKVDGSRRREKQRRQRNKLIAKNTHVKINQQLHNAKAAVTKPGVRSVAVEDTKAKNMNRSAAGSKAFPARSAGKRGLNRSLAETAPARMLGYLARAAVKHSVGYVPVYPAYTSLTCFVCGERGLRETQALFHCPCGNRTHADLQASLNIQERGHPHLYPPTGGGRDSRRKILEDAMGTFQRGRASTQVSQTNIPVNPGI